MFRDFLIILNFFFPPILPDCYKYYFFFANFFNFLENFYGTVSFRSNSKLAYNNLDCQHGSRIVSLTLVVINLSFKPIRKIITTNISTNSQISTCKVIPKNNTQSN
jgi:hypothetical protein